MTKLGTFALAAALAGACSSTAGQGTTGAAGTTAAAGTTGAAGTAAAAGTTGTTDAAGTSGVAGTSAAAGTTGAAGTTPMTIGTCSGLKPAGEWEYIWSAVAPTRTGSNPGDTTSLVADPFDAGTVWVSANKMGLFKSTDCGSTFTHVNTGTNGAELDKGGLVSMAVDPVNKGTIYVAPIYGAFGVWKSTNGGVDWVNLIPYDSPNAKLVEYNFYDSVSMDPADPKHLVVGTHANCLGALAPACEAETTDGGATWRYFKLPTKGWEEGAGPWVIDAKSWLYGGTSGLWLTADKGATWKDVTPKGAGNLQGGEVENHPLFRAADGTYLLTSLYGIVNSSDAVTWTLIPNSGGRKVGFASGAGKLFASDQWSNSYHVASESDLATWTKLPPPPALAETMGAPYLAYDAAHHILYSSNFAGGLWRVVTP